MTRQLLHRSHQAFHLHRSLPNPVSLPHAASVEHMARRHLSGLVSIFRRGSTDSSDSCSSNSSSSQCEKPADSDSVTIPVACGVVIPIVLAIIIFVYLHRRHVKKLRHEDANDPHKSLDFGLDPASTNDRKKGKKNKPEMAVTDLGVEKGTRRERGMSMDMDLGSPYVLPHGLAGSRESLHSMSRTIHSHDDRYRPATTYIPNDSVSMHSYQTSRRGADDSSSYAGSGSIKRGPRDDMKQDLLGNAQRMSRSVPPTNRSPVPPIPMPTPAKEVLSKDVPPTPQSAGLSSGAPLDTRDSYTLKEGADLRKSNNYLGAFIHSREPSADAYSQKSEYATPTEFPTTPASTLQQTASRKSPPPTINTIAPAQRPPRKQSLRASTEQAHQQNFFDDTSDYGEGFKVTPPSPHGSQPEQHDVDHGSSQAYMPPIEESALGVDDSAAIGYDVRRLSMGVRPLPPDDPTDNPEQRANRIRSFYKEYFDESKPGPKPTVGDYYEDYDQHYLGDGAIFDPVSNQFVTAQPQHPQYVEPYGRRAMTPPPRAPQFRRPHAATLSGGGRLMPPGPRAFSSASGRFGPSGRGLPKKQLPPPGPLRVLPSPHLLKEDSFALPIDFAPPTSARERQAGRPESPRGGLRPYSPIVPAHMPLMSSFDDLAAMPSPLVLTLSLSP